MSKYNKKTKYPYERERRKPFITLWFINAHDIGTTIPFKCYPEIKKKTELCTSSIWYTLTPNKKKRIKKAAKN